MTPAERIERALAARMARVERVGPLRIVTKGDAARSFIIAQDADDTVLHSRFLFLCQDGPQGREIHSHDWPDYVYSLVDGNRDIRRYTAALREAVAALEGIRRNEAYPVPRSLDWHHEDVLRADAALARIADILSPGEVKP